MRRSLAAAIVLAAMTAVGCGGESGSSSLLPQIGNPVSSVQLNPASLSLNRGTSQRIAAVGLNAQGQPVAGKSASFSSSNPQVAEVASDGLVTARAVGSAEIRANIDGLVGSAAVTVVSSPVASILVGFPQATLRVGEQSAATVVLRDAAGAEVASRPLQWTSSNPAVVQVSGEGAVVAVAPGSATVTATVDGIVGSASVTVSGLAALELTPNTVQLPVGMERGLQASLRTAAGVAADQYPVTWRSSNPAIALVNDNGVVTGVAVGSTTVVASADGLSATATIVVEAGTESDAAPVATVTATLAATTIAPGATTQATAVARSMSTKVLTGRPVSWSSSNSAVATVNATGLVTGVAAGAAQIVATVEGKTGSVTLTVQVPAVASVAAAVLPSTIVVGGTAQGTATARDASGNTLTGRTVSWESSNPAIATVNAAGVVTGVSVGSAQLTATSEGKTGTATVTVSATPPAPVATVTASLADSSIQVGGTTQASAVVRDASDNVLSGRLVSWSSSNTAIATVSSTGVVTAVAAGSAQITATSEGKTDGVTVTVSVVPVASVTVSLASSTIQVGATTQASAVSRDAASATLTGRPVTWSSSNASVASVSANGVVTGVAAGTAQIRATVEGVTGSVTVTVQAPAPTPVASVSASLAASSILVGISTQASAVARDASGNVLTGRSVSWSSSNTAIATVSNLGLVTALSAGSAQITATVEGQSGNVTLTVTAPPTGGGGGIIFADDFESDRSSAYYERGNSAAFQRVAGVGRNGSSGMRARWTAGATDAGNLKLAFGRTPNTYMRAVDAGTANYREVYWRLLVRNQPGWTGGGADKLTRGIVFANASWAEAAIGHVWSSGSGSMYLAADPASGTDASGTLQTTSYNDFANLRWLGAGTSSSAIFSSANVGQWYCVETRMKLNDAGQSNGVFELWINGTKEVSRSGLNWLGNYSAYGINALFIENYWNAGSPVAQERYIDDLVVSTQPIGCPATTNPTPTVATVISSLATSSLVTGQTTQATATARDASGTVITGRPVTWSSSNTAVATVNGSGVVSAVGAGSAQITATVDGKTGSSTLQVTAPAAVPVASVTASLTASSIAIGISTQASAVTRDASGNVLSGRAVTWSSSNSSIATVSAGGMVLAVAAGTAQITATSEGITGTATLVVPPPSTGGGGGASSLASDTFTQYTSTAQLLANTGNGKPYCEFLGSSRIALDASVTYSGHQTVRVDQPAGTNGISRLTTCFSSQNFWFRIKLRFSNGWTTAGSITSANSFKMFGWWWGEGTGRGDLEITNTTSYQLHFDPQFSGSPFVSVGAGTVSSEWTDGGWYDYIVHYEVTGSGSRTRFWLARDGQTPVLKATANGAVAATAQGVGFPFYFNQTPRANQSLWIGQWQVVDGTKTANPWGL